MSSINIQLSSNLDTTGFKQLDSAVSKARSSLGSIGKNTLGGFSSSVADASKHVGNLKQGLAGLGQALGVSSYVGQWAGLATAIGAVSIAMKGVPIFSDRPALDNWMKGVKGSGLSSWMFRKGRMMESAGKFKESYGISPTFSEIATSKLGRGVTNLGVGMKYAYSGTGIGGDLQGYAPQLIKGGGISAAIIGAFYGMTKASQMWEDSGRNVSKMWESVVGKFADAGDSIIDFVTGISENKEASSKSVIESLSQQSKTGISKAGTKKYLDNLYEQLQFGGLSEEARSAIQKQIGDVKSGKLNRQYAEQKFGVSIDSITKGQKANSLIAQGESLSEQDAKGLGVNLKYYKDILQTIDANANPEKAAAFSNEIERISDILAAFNNKQSGISSVLSDFFGDLDKEAQKLNEMFTEGRVANVLTDFFGSMDKISANRGVRKSLIVTPSDSLTNVGNFGFSGGAIYTSTFGAMNNALQQQVAITRQIEQNTRKENNAPAYKTTVTAQSGGHNAGGFGIVTQF